MLATIQYRTLCLLVCCLKMEKLEYKKIFLPVVLYGCETWSLTLREENWLRVFENRVLRIFGPKSDEVTGGLRKLHNEVLHNAYSSPSIIRMIKSRRMRWAGHVARIWGVRNEYKLWRRNLKATRKWKRSWEDNIKVDFKRMCFSMHATGYVHLVPWEIEQQRAWMPFLSTEMRSIWLCVFPSGDIHTNLWKLRCGGRGARGSFVGWGTMVLG
jgi:hypothetical protein